MTTTKRPSIVSLLLLALVALAAPGCGFAGWDPLFDIDSSQAEAEAQRSLALAAQANE